MSILNKLQLKTKLDSLITTNGNNEITGAQHNEILTDVIDSVLALIDNGQDVGFLEYLTSKDYLQNEITRFDGNLYISREVQTAGGFTPSKWVKLTNLTDLSGFNTSFPIYSNVTVYNIGDRVIDRHRYFECDINATVGITPVDSSPNWSEVYAHNGDRTLIYQPGFYLQNQVITFTDEYYILVTATPGAAFNSTDIAAEITGGDWKVFNKGVLDGTTDNTVRFNGSGDPVESSALTNDDTDITIPNKLTVSAIDASVADFVTWLSPVGSNSVLQFSASPENAIYWTTDNATEAEGVLFISSDSTYLGNAGANIVFSPDLSSVIAGATASQGMYMELAPFTDLKGFGFIYQDNTSGIVKSLSQDNRAILLGVNNGQTNSGVFNAPNIGGKGTIAKVSNFPVMNGIEMQEDKASNPSNWQALIIPDPLLTADKTLTAVNTGNISVEQNVYSAETGSLGLSGTPTAIPSASFTIITNGTYEAVFIGMLNLEENEAYTYDIRLNNAAIGGSTRTPSMANHQGAGNDEDREMVSSTIEFSAVASDVIDARAFRTTGSAGTVLGGGHFKLKFLRP